MPPSTPPKSLSTMLYLLSVDPCKGRIAARRKVGHALRAAVLIDLVIRGRLSDAGGKVQVINMEHTGDPVLDQVLDEILVDEIVRDRERKWKHWVRHDAGAVLDAVKKQLVSAGTIVVHKRLMRRKKVEVTDPASVDQLRQRILSTLRSDQVVEDLNLYEVVLTALAANGELDAAIPGKERRLHQERLRALTYLSPPVRPIAVPG